MHKDASGFAAALDEQVGHGKHGDQVRAVSVPQLHGEDNKTRPGSRAAVQRANMRDPPASRAGQHGLPGIKTWRGNDPRARERKARNGPDARLRCHVPFIPSAPQQRLPSSSHKLRKASELYAACCDPTKSPGMTFTGR